MDVAAVPGILPPPRFEEFYEAERDRLFRAMLLLARETGEAEELSQEAFLKVWERWSRVSSMDEPAAYLHRVAFNAFLSRRRRAMTSLRRPLRREVERDEMAEVDARHAVIARLQVLAVRERASIVLIDVLGYSSDEAGRLLGIRPATVRGLASRGRARLRERADDHG